MKLTVWGIVFSLVLLPFSTAFGQAIKINSSSKVGIGGSPIGSYFLYVHGKTYINGSLSASSLTIDGNTKLYDDHMEVNNGTFEIYGIMNTNVGIGNSYDNSATLMVSEFAGYMTNQFALKVEGESYTTEGIYQSSDGRLKKEIKDLSGSNILERVKQMKPKSYKFKSKEELIEMHNQGVIHFKTDTLMVLDTITGKGELKSQLHIPRYTQKEQFGLLAEEVEEIFPELVTTEKTTNLKSVNYIALIPILIEAIKDQQTQIDDLKKNKQNK